MVTDVSEEHTDPIFSAEYKKNKQQAKYPKRQVVVGKLLPDSTASYPRRL
jgi:hypothetical protein